MKGGWDLGSDSFVAVGDGMVICTDVKETILLSIVVLLVTMGNPPHHVTINFTVPNNIVLKGPRSLKW